MVYLIAGLQLKPAKEDTKELVAATLCIESYGGAGIGLNRVERMDRLPQSLQRQHAPMT